MLNLAGWIVPVAVAHEEEPDVSLIQNIDTSQFNPPLPDPSSIAYRNSSDVMAVIDSEVDDDPAIFTGDVENMTSLQMGFRSRASKPNEYAKVDLVRVTTL